jgi:nitrous oxidase accessory protein NosD
MLLSVHQNAGHNHNIMIANKFFENMSKLKYFGKTLTDKITFTKKLRSHYVLGMFLPFSSDSSAFPSAI